MAEIQRDKNQMRAARPRQHHGSMERAGRFFTHPLDVAARRAMGRSRSQQFRQIAARARAVRQGAVAARGNSLPLRRPGERQPPDAVPEQSIALLSPQIQRELATGESSFYQSRWHSGVSEGRRTVAQFLSQASVEDINPFEVDAPRSDPRRFRENRRRFSRWLGIEPLFRRKLAVLSNGEQRRVLLVHTLLRSPRLLILDDPFGGLDQATRARLKTVIHRLMRAGLPVLLITNRPDELPQRTTHLLLVRDHRVIAQGTKRAMLKHPLARRNWNRPRLPRPSSSSSKIGRRKRSGRAADRIEPRHRPARTQAHPR